MFFQKINLVVLATISILVAGCHKPEKSDAHLLLAIKTMNAVDRIVCGSYDDPAYVPERQLRDLEDVQALLKSHKLQSSDLGRQNGEPWIGELRQVVKTRIAAHNFLQLKEMADRVREVKPTKEDVKVVRGFWLNIHTYLSKFKSVDGPEVSYGDVDLLLERVERAAGEKVTAPRP